MTQDPAKLLDDLFPMGHDTHQKGARICGSARTSRGQIQIIGTPPGTGLDARLALDLAADVLKIIKDHPGRPILLMIDTTGQVLSRQEEMLGLNRYLAHLAKCIFLARTRGHHVIGLVYGQSVSGGALATSLLADDCYALPSSRLMAMNLTAMARVTPTRRA